MPDCLDASFEAIVAAGHRNERRAFRLPVNHHHVAAMHFFYNSLHDLDRARRPAHSPGTQGRQVKPFEFWLAQLGDEHGR